jgi:hypothetical protein
VAGNQFIYRTKKSVNYQDYYENGNDYQYMAAPWVQGSRVQGYPIAGCGMRIVDFKLTTDPHRHTQTS